MDTLIVPRFNLKGIFLQGVLDGDQELWLLGGNAGTHWMDSIDIFHPADGSWRAGPTMPTVRGYGAAAILGRQLYVAGGGDGSNWLSSMLRLSLDDGTWSEVCFADSSTCFCSACCT